MDLNGNSSVGVLYDLAMAMAGETRPHPLATTMLQRFLSHTGCACGAVLLDAPGGSGAGDAAPMLYVAIGNRWLRSQEGGSARWTSPLPEGDHGEAPG